LLLVEVSDTTLTFDIETKVPLYARAGISEVWVVNVNARSVHVYRDPHAGAYASSFVVLGDKSVAPLALPEARIALSDMFPV
jgi:Uma2 family endonuclease